MNNLFQNLSAGIPSMQPAATAQTGNAENSPEDIPHEELMQLCMKMNKRMQAMDTKGKELLKKKSILLSERRKLLGMIRLSSNIPINDLEDQDLDMPWIESKWKEWDDLRREHLMDLEHKITAWEENRKTASIGPMNGAVNGESPSDDSNVQSGVSKTPEVELQVLRGSLADLQTRYQKSQSEVERLRGMESFLTEQSASLESALADRTGRLESVSKELESCKLVFEEKLLFLQMQSNAQKGKDDGRDKELAAARARCDKLSGQVSALEQVLEEKDLSVRSNKEMIAALQARLIETEPELAQARERVREMERNGGVSALLKAEQDALLASLRRELRQAREEGEVGARHLRELEEFRVRAEGQLLGMAALSEQVSALQRGLEDKEAFVTRLRSEAQAAERNHAMRTAMLATVEAQLEALRTEGVAKDATSREAVERVTELQAALAASEARLEERVRYFNEQSRLAEASAAEAAASHTATVRQLRVQHEEALEAAKRDHARKSAMARTLLSEREEEVRLLSARVQEQHEEITSGAPSERKIFELAQTQARREATHGMHRDTREVAFQQLQSALAGRDLDLARHQHSLAQLTAEVVELRRTHQRDGINMDYLKNIVIQYMTLPVQSSERMSLVPVLAMLLQFSPKELAAVQRSDLNPLWGSKPAKEVKRFAAPPPTKAIQQIAPSSSSGTGSGGAGSVAPNRHPSSVPPASVIMGAAAEGALELSESGDNDDSTGGYVPPGVQSSEQRPSNGGRKLLSRHAGVEGTSRAELEAMTQSDADLEVLRGMDVLNVSSSDGDLAERAATTVADRIIIGGTESRTI